MEISIVREIANENKKGYVYSFFFYRGEDELNEELLQKVGSVVTRTEKAEKGLYIYTYQKKVEGVKADFIAYSKDNTPFYFYRVEWE